MPIVTQFPVAQIEHYQMFPVTYELQLLTGEYPEQTPPERANPVKQAVHPEAVVVEHVPQFKLAAVTHVFPGAMQYPVAHVAQTVPFDPEAHAV